MVTATKPAWECLADEEDLGSFWRRAAFNPCANLAFSAVPVILLEETTIINARSVMRYLSTE